MTEGLRGALTLERTGARMGAERVALLAAVGRTGSISAAAREVGLSYKAAWDGVKAMNNLFSSPLVTAAPGGRAGGGAELTAAGRQVIAAYGEIEAELAKLLARLENRLDLAPAQVLRGLSLRTSARNVWACKVSSVLADRVSAEVKLDLGGAQLVSVITARSARELGLMPGVEVLALVKSNFVMLTREEAPRLSIRNRLSGVVMERIDGDLGTEVVLDLGAGKTLAAAITRESADGLAPAPGERLTALVKSSHVILALP
ncbi:molybdenum-dependent transcriptional regulator [Rhodobacter sp. TJ_12]|uniref:TOBE domain-containing protein n=1 Tax=Rhodobacter sp. TJ_12 TaxID=2029399 RepID=UPI001CBB1C22|nr:TOBE domain-containing protein [Rhodobacter sp. TJ_12]MBZ4023283.1 molybdenum-dependent transcriptional regulator [Rhodobacter sp. TJ_12]